MNQDIYSTQLQNPNRSLLKNQLENQETEVDHRTAGSTVKKIGLKNVYKLHNTV